MSVEGSGVEGDRSLSFLAGGGECGALVRALDWAKTPIGAVERWPNSLRTTVATVLRSKHPMFLWWGPELVQVYNDAYAPSFGSGRHPAAMGMRGRDCWHDIWPIIGPQIDGVMSRGEATWHEDHLVPILRNDRLEEVYWTYGYSPVLDESGAIGGTLVVCTETTGRVLTERRLRTSRALVDATGAALTTTDVLEQAIAVLGGAREDVPFALIYDRDPITGAPRLAASSGLDEPLRTELDRLLAPHVALADAQGAPSEPRPVDVRTLAIPGEPWPELTTTALVVPIAPPHATRPSAFLALGLSPRLPFDARYRGHLLDLAAHVGLAQARIASLRGRAAAESERDGVLLQAPVAAALMTGPDHVFQLANPLYHRMVGRDDLVGKAYLEAFPELDGTPIPQLLDRAYRTGTPLVAQEQRAQLDRRGDGTLEERFFTFNLAPIRDAGGDVYGMMAIAIDITEQVRARQVLERAQVEREKLLAELETASRAKDEFLAMLGHELRNPLSPIVTALQLMRMRDGEGSRERKVIERQVDHLQRLVDDLLDVSRITRGKVELRKEIVEIADVVARAVEIASFLLEQRRHELEVRVPRALEWDGDPVRLSQVVANLLTNAARYTEPGGHVALDAWREGADVVLRVRDDGRGIAEDLLPRIFDPFVQGKRGFDRAEGGLGIGLTLAKSLVVLHGGTITARSEGLGRGSEFEIRLPGARDPDGGRRQTDRPGAPPASRRRRRVLVVDDNADAAAVLADLLRARGHEVAVETDPVTALARLDAFAADVALLDIGLPAMDGYELATRIRARPTSARARLVALSGYGHDHDEQRAADAGFDEHFVKPVVIADLLRILEQP